MAKWAVDWQNKNPSIVCDMDAPKPKNMSLSNDEKKFAWVESLQPGDEIWTELGASADILCALALKKGVKVRRIQTHILKDWRKANGLDAGDSFKSLVRFAEQEPEKFYETPPAVAEVLGLRCLVRHFEITQEMRKSEAHRLRGVAIMEYFLSEKDEEQNALTEDELAAKTKSEKKLVDQLEELLGEARDGVLRLIADKHLPQELRRKFAAQFSAKRLAAGIMDEITGRKRKRSDTDLEIYLRRRFAESHIFWGIEREEEYYAAEVEAHLEGMELYRDVYKQIPGMGPKISGRIMAAIGDIRRFRSAYALAAYFGWHVRPDGSCPRRVKSMSDEMRETIAEEGGRWHDYGAWNKLGRQGFFLWAEQVNRATPEKTPLLVPYREMLLRRKAYVARKYWLKAAEETVNDKSSPEIMEFLKAMQAAGQVWLQNGGALPGNPDNPYLATANEAQVVSQPWMLRDALAELRRQGGEKVPDSETEANDPSPEEDEEVLFAQDENSDKAVKTKFCLPKMVLQPKHQKEMRSLMRNYFLSRKRIHQGGYRWLINNVLIRKLVWPLNRAYLGLSRHPNPARYEKLRERGQMPQQDFEPVRFTDIAEREGYGDSQATT